MLEIQEAMVMMGVAHVVEESVPIALKTGKGFFVFDHNELLEEKL
ncbi:MAG: hypothetical protein ACOYJB_09140 [Christensenellaceae bacterium]|jgi:hypothetical protein